MGSMRSTAGCVILTILLGICANGCGSSWLRPKIEVQKSVMSEDLEREAFQVALVAVNIYTEENAMAKYIAKEFDKRHKGTWQCIMGTSGYWVQWIQSSYIRFNVGEHRITLFKTA